MDVESKGRTFKKSDVGRVEKKQTKFMQGRVTKKMQSRTEEQNFVNPPEWQFGSHFNSNCILYAS